MVGAAVSSSCSRSPAPIARWNSAANSLSEPTVPAASTAKNRNADRSPAVIRPASRSLPPIHSSTPIARKTRKMTQPLNSARARTRRAAVAKARSVRSAKVAVASSCRLKACTVRTALRVSSIWAPRSPMRSCAARDSRRTLRPNTTSGSTTSGITTSTKRVSLRLVTAIMTTPPVNIRMLRSAIDAELPMIDWSRVVSVVRRDSTSPVGVIS